MALKKFATRDEIPADQRDAAFELKDGTFALEEATEPDLGEAGKKALETMKREKREAEKRARDAQEELDRLKLEAEAREHNVSEEKLAEIRRKAEEKWKPIETERDTLAAENRKLKLTDKVRADWIKFGGHPEREEDAMRALELRTDLGDKGGIVFKDKDGNVTADDAETFHKKFKVEKPWFYRGSGSAGGGATGSDSAEEPTPQSRTPETVKQEKRAQIAAAL